MANKMHYDSKGEGSFSLLMLFLRLNGQVPLQLLPWCVGLQYQFLGGSKILVIIIMDLW